MPVPMVDTSGQLVHIDDGDVQGAFQSGKYAFLRPDQKIPVRNQEGKVGTIDAARAQDAFGAGVQVTSEELLHKAQTERKYGGAGSAAAAGATGVARGLTFGLSDEAIRAAAKATGREQEALDRLRAYREVQPVASTTGEIAGAIAPVLLSGGAAAPESATALAATRGAAEGVSIGRGLASATRGVGALPRAVAGLGGLAERGASKLVGEGATSVAGRAFQRAVPLAAQGALEGSVYGAGEAITEDALSQDHDLTAEKLMAAAGHGAMMGGIGGGLLGAGSAVASRALEGAAAKLGDGGLANSIDAFASKKAFKALGPTLDDERAVEKFVAGGKESIGEDVRKLIPDAVGKPLAMMSVDEINAGASKVKARAAEQLDEIVNAIDASGSTVQARPAELLARIDKEVLEPLRGKAGFEAIQANVARYRDSLAATLEEMAPVLPPSRFSEPLAKLQTQEKALLSSGAPVSQVREVQQIMRALVDTEGAGARAAAGQHAVPLSALREQRKALDDLIYRAKSAAGNPSLNPSPAVDELRNLRRVMEDYIVETGEKAAQETGGSFAKEYKEAKRVYQSMKTAEKISGNQVLRAERNRSVSLTDYIAGAGALASGHPILGVVTSLGNKILRERGNQITADLVGRVASLNAAKRAVNGVDGQLDGAVRGFLRSGTRKVVDITAPAVEQMGERRRASSQPDYATTVERVASAASDPHGAAHAIGQSLGDLGSHAPNVSAALASKATTATTYLASHIPPGHVDPSSLQPQFKKARVSDTDKAMFLRRARAVDDPTSVVKSLRTGRVTHEEVDALRTVYPKLYAQVQRQLHAEVLQLKEPLPFAKRVQLATFFGIPTDYSLEPQNVKAWQATYPQSASGAPGPAPQPHRAAGATQLKSIASVATPFQRGL